MLTRVAFGLYALAGRLGTPLVRRVLQARARRGKEDPGRLGERWGQASLARPPGALVWIHAASVGESLAVLPVIERLRAERPGLTLLITSGTVTSARLLAQRLPPGVLHQFAPVDLPVAVERFLAHWRPALALFVESELWPNMIRRTAAAGVPLTLINARMSAASFRSWWRWRPLARGLLSDFRLVLAESEESAARFRDLGAPQVLAPGNLKLAASPLTADAAELAALKAAIGGRPVWIAASTHPGEEEIVAAAHRLIARRFPDLLTVLAPRHPQRGAEIAAALGLRVARRAAGERPDAGTEVYLADTLGELGLIYRLGGVVLIGGSLVPKGGQNLLEPARLGPALIAGPHTENFAALAERLESGGALLRASGAEELAARVAELLSDPAKRDRVAAAAEGCSRQEAAVLDRTLEALAPLLDGIRR